MDFGVCKNFGRIIRTQVSYHVFVFILLRMACATTFVGFRIESGSKALFSFSNKSLYPFDFCLKNNIDKLDISFIESEKAVGIAQVRDFQKRIFLKPFKSKQKAVILSTQNTITTEAQNALLKVLEEPPDNTILLLICESSEDFLPTIISRCKIITLDKEPSEINLKEYGEILLSLKDKKSGGVFPPLFVLINY